MPNGVEGSPTEASPESKDLTFMADMGGAGEPLPIKITPGILERLQETLSDKGLTTKKVGIGVFAIGLAVGAGIAAKKFIDRQKELNEPLTDSEKEKFMALLDRTYESVFNYMNFGLIGRPQLAEDKTQEVYLNAFKAFKRYKPNSKLEDSEKSWIMWIAHNQLANTYRDEGRKDKKTTDLYVNDENEGEREITLPDPVLNTIHSLESEITQEPSAEIVHLHSAFTTLSNAAQMALYLKYTEHLTNREIGYILRRSEGAIKSLCKRSLDKLRESFTESSVNGID